MSDLQSLLDEVDQLSPEELKQLYAHILEKHIHFAESDDQTTSEPRILGLHAHLGTAWMSDDFKEELPDEFWLDAV